MACAGANQPTQDASTSKSAYRRTRTSAPAHSTLPRRCPRTTASSRCPPSAPVQHLSRCSVPYISPRQKDASKLPTSDKIQGWVACAHTGRAGLEDGPVALWRTKGAAPLPGQRLTTRMRGRGGRAPPAGHRIAGAVRTGAESCDGPRRSTLAGRRDRERPEGETDGGLSALNRLDPGRCKSARPV